MAGDACLSHFDNLPQETVTGDVTQMQGNLCVGLLGQREVEIFRPGLTQTKHINERQLHGDDLRLSSLSVTAFPRSCLLYLAGATT